MDKLAAKTIGRVVNVSSSLHDPSSTKSKGSTPLFLDFDRSDGMSCLQGRVRWGEEKWLTDSHFFLLSSLEKRIYL
jgi:hypothetical protein